MPGTLSATVSIVAGAETDAAFAGSGALSSVTAPKMAAALTLAGAGYLDTAAAFARYAQAAALSGGGALTAPTPLRIHPMAASFAGAGALAATAAQTGPADDFNRANSTTTLGANWVPRDAGVLGINANGAYAVANDPVVEEFTLATWVNPMWSEDVEVSIVTGAIAGNFTYDADYVVLGCNSTGEGVLMYTSISGAAAAIYTMDAWGSLFFRAGDSFPMVAGDKFTLRRIGSAYYIVQNDSPYYSVAWNDSGNVVPRDSSHRLVGIGSAGDGTNYRRINSWEARVSGVVPLPAPSSANFSGGGALSATARRKHPMSAALAGAGTLSATATKAPPTITNITTSPFAVGNTITLTGTNYSGTVSVTVGGVAATSVTVGSTTSLTCVIPSVAAGAQNVIVTAASGASSAFSITIVIPKAHYSDDFNRANSTTTLGANWTARFNIVGINSNNAYAATANANNAVTFNSAMLTDDFDVSITMGTVNPTNIFYIFLGFNTTGEGVEARITTPSTNKNISIYSHTTGNFDPLSNITGRGVAVSNATVVAGDVYTLRRVGNVYTVLRNGVATTATWTDSGNVVPRDSSHRLAGFALWGGTGSSPINAWAADDI